MLLIEDKGAYFMRKPWETIKIKILSGYLFLIGIASFTVWLIYSEILMFSDNRLRIDSLNNKILYFNSVLTNLYQAEALERTYSQTGNPDHYKNYERLMDIIYLQFDSLSLISDNPNEKLHTDSIIILLEKKRKNLHELTLNKKITSSDNFYERALDKFAFSKDSTNSLLNVNKTVTETQDSIYVEQKKRKFFKRLAYVFNPKEQKDSTLQVIKQLSVHTDTITKTINPTDSILLYLSEIMTEMREESQDRELQMARKEMEVLANDRTITLQLRQILSIFEKDIFVNSLNEMHALQDRIRHTTTYLIALGILAVLVIGIFLILILKDITRSQRYRVALEKAKAFSDSLLKSKEQFMLSITHDIKSPIASVNGYARLMLMSDNKQQKNQYLDNITKSTQHILKLINDLVDLSKLETGKLKIEISQFNLTMLVKDICSGFVPLAASKNLEFKVEFKAAYEYDHYGDPVRIKQILSNIISNAIKYTDEGRVNVIMSQTGFEENADLIRFDVIDTGIGISDKEAGLIFNEFTQVADRQRYEGAGLGLSISRRLTSLLNGNISLKSTPGRGSQFTIILPLERCTFPAVHFLDVPEAIHHPIETIEKTDSKNILVIDDDFVFLNLIAENLQRYGMKVMKCTSPSEAIWLVDIIKPDLIITDMRMPDISGIDMLSFIQRKSGKNIPVIAMSGDDAIKPDKYPAVLISSYLKKPFNPEELFEHIDNVFKKKIPLNKLFNINGKNKNRNKTLTSVTYSLDQIRQFTLNDTKSLHSILTSFVESNYEHMIVFEKNITDKNRKTVSELAHKMLAMFRQLDAMQIVQPLMQIEKDTGDLNDEKWEELCRDTLQRIIRFIDRICIEQGILVKTIS